MRSSPTAEIHADAERREDRGRRENADYTEGQIALQFGVGAVKFRKVQIKPL